MYQKLSKEENIGIPKGRVMNEEERVLYDYAISFYHTPFMWKGKSVLEGMDSASLVIEILKSAGLLFGSFDGNAQHLYNMLVDESHDNEKKLGSVSFYGRDRSQIYHCGFMLTKESMIEMGNGSSKIVTFEDAIIKNSRARLMPYDYRSDLIEVINIL